MKWDHLEGHVRLSVIIFSFNINTIYLSMGSQAYYVLYRRILLTEKIKYHEENKVGHLFMFDKKGIYSKFSDTTGKKNQTLMISYGSGGTKSLYPESEVYKVLYDRWYNGDVYYIYMVYENKQVFIKSHYE